MPRGSALATPEEKQAAVAVSITIIRAQTIILLHSPIALHNMI